MSAFRNLLALLGLVSAYFAYPLLNSVSVECIRPHGYNTSAARADRDARCRGCPGIPQTSAPKMPDLTLYFSIGSCSGSAYMALITAGVPFKCS